MSEKSCTKCNVIKDLSEFKIDKRLKSGKSSVCKACSSKIARKWALDNIEQHKSNNKLWREANKAYDSTRKIKWAKDNPERKKAIDKKYHTANREYRIQKTKMWREHNQERYLVNRRQYYQKYGYKILAYNKFREQLKCQRTPKWLTDSDKFLIQQFYAEAKQKSKDTGVTYHVDHIIPLNGKLVCGLHVPNNLQVITAFENITKHNKYLP